MKYRKFYTIAIFGNRFVLNKQRAGEKLYNYLKGKLKDNRVRALVGTHGDFDKIAFCVCKRLEKEGFDIDIKLVYTSLRRLIKENSPNEYAPLNYRNDETMMYEIEEVHFKRKIIVSNQKMIDESDEIVIYHNGRNSYSGINRVVKYAKKVNKPIQNLFETNDREDY